MAEGGIRLLNVHDALCLTCVAIFQRLLFINIYIFFFLFTFFFLGNTVFSVFEDEEGGKV